MSYFGPVPNTNRAQSETLGVALLLGVAVIGAVAVAATGFAALDRDRERAGLAQAERSLAQFDSETSALALGRSGAVRMDFGLPDSTGTMSVRDDEGWMRVRVSTGRGDPGGPPPDPGEGTPPTDPGRRTPPLDPGGGTPPTDAGNGNPPPGERRRGMRTVADVTLGSVVYQQGDRTVGYQSGGVFRSDGSGSVLVSRPEFHYRNGTLTVPIVRTDGSGVLGGEVQVRPNGTHRKFPEPSGSSEVDGTVTVTVKSRYHEAWRGFFRDQTPGTVLERDDDPRTVTVRFTRVDFLHVTVHRMRVSSG